jgi:hypothetical protein
MTLRASTHDWDPSQPGANHTVSVRFAARYSGAAFVAVSSPGGGGLVDIGNGRLKVWRRVGSRNEFVDETGAVQAALVGRWDPGSPHTYTLEWKSADSQGKMPFRLLVDGKLVKDFVGHERPGGFDPTLEISLERGAGTGLIDWVEWKINDGRPKPAQIFTVEKGVRQLFLDDAGIERIEGLQRVIHQPRRHPNNPIVKGERPWERASASVYGTMLYDVDRKQFRLWYLCSPAPPETGRKWVEVGGYRRVTNCTLLAYATSRDAVVWEKPDLGQLSFEGSKKNNLIDIGVDNPEGVGVLRDQHDADPNRRYKAFFWDRRLSPPDDPTGVDATLARVPKEPPGLTDRQRSGGMWVAFSPDGITWKTHGPVLSQGSDTTHTILYDPKQKKYVAYGRMGLGRTVAMTESDDALHWSEPRRVLACDGRDGPGGQIYGMPTDLYEGVYLGMFWMYREGTDARIDTQLATSRDGRRWQRVADRQTFLPNAPQGCWDDGMSRAGRAINVVGDTIYLHYSMVNGPHRSPKFPKPERKFPGAIGLVTLRRDGFVSLDAGAEPGALVTKPFAWPGGKLLVNADTSRGWLRVSVLDKSGEPIRGFEGSRPISADSTRSAVCWCNANLDRLGNRQIRLKFTLQQGRLFSYWIGEAP